MTKGQEMKSRVDNGKKVMCPQCKTGTIEDEGATKTFYKCNACNFGYRISRGTITI